MADCFCNMTIKDASWLNVATAKPKSHYKKQTWSSLFPEHLMWQSQENGHWVNSVDKLLVVLPWKVRPLVIYNTGSLSRLSDSDLAKAQRTSICPHMLQVFICALQNTGLSVCVNFKHYKCTLQRKAREFKPPGLTLVQINKGPNGADLIEDIYWVKFATDAVKVLILNFSPCNLILPWSQFSL